MTDLTHLMNRTPIFTPVQQPDDLHYDHMAMLGGGMMFPTDSTTAANEIGGGGNGGSGNCRWPRQETLTLLEIRSNLDSKFKEANHKGPLWDEVSRIMSEEHGYERSGKKCREKFENLYKYYKKTKEGKAGRQDGKHYRFFRQLEALYGGETSTTSHVNPNSTPIIPTPTYSGIETCGFQAHNNTNYQELYKPVAPCDSPTLSNNSSAFDTCSSGYSNPSAFMENMSDCLGNKRRFDWKTKIKEFVDVQMKKVLEKQEEWMEKMMRCIEQKEQERVLREEQWRKEEAARFEKEHKFWANERAWMESRDLTLMEALHKLSNGKSDTTMNPTPWGENELTRLIQLRTSMETRFEHSNAHMEELLWEEIGSKMACLGYNRHGVSCKTKWDSINEFLLRTKKRKDNIRISNSYTHPIPHIFHHQAGSYQRVGAPNDEENDGSHRFAVVDHENTWDGFGMKLRMGEDP